MRNVARKLGDSPKQQERVLLGLVSSFLILAFAQLWLQESAESPLLYAGPALSIMIATTAAHFWLRRAAPQSDPFILPLTACLSSLSLVMLRRLAPNFVWRQTLWLIAGLLVMLTLVLVSRDLRWLRRYRYTWFGLGIFLLALTLLLGVNPLGRGARLWLGLAGMYLQPSELLKVMFVVFLSSYLAEKHDLIRQSFSRLGCLKMPPLPYLVPMLLVWGTATLLLTAQQDLGAGTLLFGTFLAMLYVSTRQSYYAVLGLVLMGLSGLAARSISPFVDLRIQVWLNPWIQPESGGYQVIQSLISFAAGSVFGTGLGRGYGARYIPVVHTDFVFAAIGEELGLCGALAVLMLYVFLFYRGLRVAILASSAFERLLAAGLSFGLALQAWVIAGGNLKILPLTGVTLPFVSYGGSSLIASYIAVGLLLVISSRGQGPRAHCGPVPTDVPIQPGSSLHAFCLNESTVMGRSLLHLLALVLLCFSLLIGGLLYWQVISAEDLLRRSDNPRLYNQRSVAPQDQLFRESR